MTRSAATRLAAAGLAAAVGAGAVLGGATVLWCEPLGRAVEACCCPDAEQPAQGPSAGRACCAERTTASLPVARDGGSPERGVAASPVVAFLSIAEVTPDALGAAHVRTDAMPRAGPPGELRVFTRAYLL